MLTNDRPTVVAPTEPSERDRLGLAPPKVPYEFGYYTRHDFAPESDPLREAMPLRTEKEIKEGKRS